MMSSSCLKLSNLSYLLVKDFCIKFLCYIQQLLAVLHPSCLQRIVMQVTQITQQKCLIDTNQNGVCFKYCARCLKLTETVQYDKRELNKLRDGQFTWTQSVLVAQTEQVWLVQWEKRVLCLCCDDYVSRSTYRRHREILERKRMLTDTNSAQDKVSVHLDL